MTHGLVSLLGAGQERGLQDDVFATVERALAARIAADPDGQESLIAILIPFLPDPGYRSNAGLTFYGAAAFCLRLAQGAGFDYETLLRDAFGKALENADAPAEAGASS